MPTKLLIPPAYVEELQKNKYVQKATEWTISFTPEFKQLVYDEYCKGKSVRQVLIDYGFDVKIIGTSRIQNFRNKLVKAANSDKNFEDKRNNNGHPKLQSTEAQMAKRMRELEHRNAYLEQENDFLKKIQFLEKECSGKAGKRK